MITLSELITTTKEELDKLQYADSTIKQKQRIWKQFQTYCNERNIVYYEHDVAMSFLSECHNIQLNKKLLSSQVFKLKSINMLEEVQITGHFQKCNQKKRIIVPIEYVNIFQNYHERNITLKLCKCTITTKEIYIKRFLNFLKENHILQLNQITNSVISSFMESLINYSSQTKSAVLFSLRDFFNWANQINLISQSGWKMLPIIFTNKRDKILSYYETSDIKKILKEVDISTAIGKRDYIILLLAIQLGIRASDIRNLKVSNINFSTKTISFIQQKTKIPIQLPLPENIEYALIDYLKNGRPNTTESNIFVGHKAPYQKYSNSNSFHYVIKMYMKKAGININNKKHGIHSMRHSLASNLLEHNTPMPVITGILGHNNINTTNIYLNIDVNKLRKLALEVPIK